MSYQQVPNGYVTWVQVEMRRAADLLGKRMQDLSFVACDFSGDQWSSVVSGSGTVVHGTTAGSPSLAVISTGTTGSSQAFAVVGPLGTADQAMFAKGGASGEFYMSGRYKLATSMSGLTGHLGMTSYNETLVIGYHNTSSSTKFSATFANGSALVSSLDVDTSFRTHRVWRASSGSSTTYTIDDAYSVSGDTYPTNPVGIACHARNFGSAADRVVHCDWLFAAVSRAA